MQENQLNRLTNLAFNSESIPKEKIKQRLDSIEAKNNKALAGKLPDYERTPTAEELAAMKEWGAAYKKQIPRASKREVRKAIQQHFHIRIYK